MASTNLPMKNRKKILDELEEHAGHHQKDGLNENSLRIRTGLPKDEVSGTVAAMLADKSIRVLNPDADDLHYVLNQRSLPNPFRLLTQTATAWWRARRKTA